ncbi:MAG: hypothetical protein IKQ97_11185 [Eubacterium sp.]|nr:hypothetical protein [Eubacterium sp.]
MIDRRGQISEAMDNTGKVIRKNILSTYPGAVLYGLFFNVSLMLDSIIAGQSLGAQGVAAVALGVPGHGILSAIVYSLIHGSGLRMIWAKGRADDHAFRRALNGGATVIALCGIVFTLLLFIFAEDIVILCGGDMVDAATLNDAVIYLRYCSPITTLTALGITLQEIMNVFGFQNSRAVLSVINVVVNLAVSILCVSYLPAGMKLAGLGIGTAVAGLAEFMAGVIIFRIKKVHLGYRPMIPRLRELVEMLKCGFPASTDYLVENIAVGFQNNVILSGFPGDPLMLPVADVVCNISYFAAGAIKGAALATEPLFGVYYEERDVNSIKQVWKQGLILGLVMSVIWSVLFLVFQPALSSLFGMRLTEDISTGVLICMIFTPIGHVVYMFTLYYEATKRFALSTTFAVLPDSVLFIVLMVLLIPVLGKFGVWLPITGNQVIGMVLLIPIVCFILGRLRKGADKLLLLPKEFYTGVTIDEFEILGDKEDLSVKMGKFKGILQETLSDTDKADAVITGVEEIVSYMSRTSKHIHIKLRDEGDKKEIFVRSIGQSCYLPEAVTENDNVWRDAVTVTYSYVYKMNIVRLRIC